MQSMVTTVGDFIIADEPGFACSKTKLVDTGLIHLRPFNIDLDGRISFAELYRVPPDGAPAGRAQLDAGDILFNNTNSAELVGKSALVVEPIEAGFSNHINRIRVNESKVDPRWFALWIRKKRETGFFTQNATRWVSQAAFKTSDLRRLPIIIPPLAEQRRVADVLSRAESIVRMRREAEQKAKEIIPALFTQMFGDPIENPLHWRTPGLKDIGLVQLGRQRAPQYQTGRFARPYMRVANVLEDAIDLSSVLLMDFDDQHFLKYRLKFGDILLNEGQSLELVGRPAMWRDEIADCCYQKTLLLFRPDPAQMTPEFALTALLIYFRRGILAKISSKTSNVAHLSAIRFEKLTLPCPPAELQRLYAERYKRVYELQKSLRSATTLAAEASRALLARAFGEGQ